MSGGSRRAVLSRALWSLAGLATALALTVAMPGTAAGKEQGGLVGAFRLSGSHGFKILGLPYIGGEGRPDAITLFVGRQGQSVVYSAPAEVTQTTVRADLGPLGEIDVQVVPTGVEESTRSSCGGKTYHYEGAAFEGTIDLHGEGSFTAVEATRARLLLKPILDLVCSGSDSSEASGHGVPGAELRLKQKIRQPRVTLQLNQNRPRGQVRYEAQIEDKRGSLRIARSVIGHLPGRSFSCDENLGSADFRAAGPFSGRADYRASPGGGRWTGDLSVDFPGRGGVALTGSDFSATLSHARRTESQIGK